MISTSLQIILAIIIILALFIIAYIIFNYEKLSIMQSSSKIKKKIEIFEGILDFSTIHDVTYNTYNKNSISYKELSPSINQKGGAEYSYNFWLKINKDSILTSNPSKNDIILLLRGSKMQIPYENTEESANCLLTNNNEYILVKNPLIRLKSDGSSIIVEYNTITNPDAYRNNGTTLIDCKSGNWDDRNKGLLGIYNMNSSEYNNNWFMVTVVLREITPENDILYKNKTSCKIYINGINMLDREVESPYNGEIKGSAAMKHNKAPLYVNPGNLLSLNDNKDTNIFNNDNSESSPISMADLSYYNYALFDDQIKSIFSQKFNKKPIELPREEDNKYNIASINTNSQNMPLPY